MHILTLLFMFIVASIVAACKGDYSGIEALGKFVSFFALMFVILWLFTQPGFFIIIIVIILCIVIWCCAG